MRIAMSSPRRLLLLASLALAGACTDGSSGKVILGDDTAVDSGDSGTDTAAPTGVYDNNPDHFIGWSGDQPTLNERVNGIFSLYYLATGTSVGTDYATYSDIKVYEAPITDGTECNVTVRHISALSADQAAEDGWILADAIAFGSSVFNNAAAAALEGEDAITTYGNEDETGSYENAVAACQFNMNPDDLSDIASNTNQDRSQGVFPWTGNMDFVYEGTARACTTDSLRIVTGPYVTAGTSVVIHYSNAFVVDSGEFAGRDIVKECFDATDHIIGTKSDGTPYDYDTDMAEHKSGWTLHQQSEWAYDTNGDGDATANGELGIPEAVQVEGFTLEDGLVLKRG